MSNDRRVVWTDGEDFRVVGERPKKLGGNNECVLYFERCRVDALGGKSWLPCKRQTLQDSMLLALAKDAFKEDGLRTITVLIDDRDKSQFCGKDFRED
jgi:hypothetical protein